MKIRENCLVELEYRLTDQNGNVVESSADDGPIVYLHGHEEIQPRLEQALDGATQGQSMRVTLPAGEAFGEYDPEQIIAVPRADLPPDAELVPGDWISISMDRNAPGPGKPAGQGAGDLEGSADDAEDEDDEGAQDDEHASADTDEDADGDGDEEEGDEDDSSIEMRVVELRPDAVFLDANHPLAGQEVTFSVKVLSVRAATPDEVERRLREAAEAADEDDERGERS